MDYQGTLAYLDSLVDYERRTPDSRNPRFFKLERMRVLLEQLGHPEARFPSIHISGTNGKGSVAAMVASVLNEAGLSAGLYTSPHLISCRERIVVQGKEVSEETLASLATKAEGAVRAMSTRPDLGQVTFFELYTAMAFLHFSEFPVDIAVVEVGLGGRLDATNTVEPLVVALTPISLDHTAELGSSIEAIAGEKSGIIKTDAPVVMAPQPEEASRVIRRRCKEARAPLVEVFEDGGPGVEQCVRVGRVRETLDGCTFDVRGRLTGYDELKVPLLGGHQAVNAAVAVAVIECLQEDGWQVRAEQVRSGLGRVQWPGRLQLLRGRPDILVDGGHNPAAVKTLVRFLARHFEARRKIFVLGLSTDKELEAIGRMLLPIASEIVLTRAANPRAADPVELQKRLGMSDPVLTGDVRSGIGRALELAGPDDLICVAGSFFVAGEALQVIGKLGYS